MTIDPRIGMYLNILAAVLTGLLGAAAMFTDLVGAQLSLKIIAGLGIALIIVNGILHAIPSKQGATNEFPLGPKAVAFIAVLMTGFLIVGTGSVQAAPRAKASASTTAPATPVNPLQSFIDQLNKKAAAINNFTLADAQAAMTMAANDPIGLACYTAIANKIQSSTPGSILPRSLGLLQLIETARLAKLQIAGVQNGTDPVVSGCAALILDANTTLMMLAGQGVVGAAGLTVGVPGL